MLESKLAQQMAGVRPYDMGTLDKPNLNNIVKNIQTLVDAFNYLSFEVNEQKKSLKAIESSPTGGSNVADQQEQAGIKVTP